MAFRIPCPHCGSRPYTEFWYGDAVHEAPTTPEDIEVNYERVWLSDNIAGVQSERWFHHAGCRRWLTVVRDTRTNEIHAVR